MSTPTPALDFCRKVEVWQQDAARQTAGLVVVLPDGEEDSLDALLAEADRAGNLNWSETRARRWLVGYQAMEAEQRVLTESQRRELDSIVTCIPLWDARQARGHQALQRRRLTTAVIAAAIAIAALITGIIIWNLQPSSPQLPPPAGPVAAAPQQPAPGALTDLQRFRADWNVPSAATGESGDPRQLVLLQDGLYYPTQWAIPAGDPGWVANTPDSITQATVHGDLADVTDVNGTTWTVAVMQPFVLASDPSAVFHVLRDGTIQSMPQPHAIRVRTRL